MQIEAKGAIYDMEWKKLDFETWDVRHEGKSKLMPQIRNSHTRARELVKKFIADLYDIGFLRSPGFLRLHVGSRWDQKGEDCRRLESLGSFCIVGFFLVATNNRLRSKEAHLRFVCTRASQRRHRTRSG